jgi:hypothetical protein
MVKIASYTYMIRFIGDLLDGGLFIGFCADLFVGDFSSFMFLVVSFLIGGGSIFFLGSGFLIIFSLGLGFIGMIIAISSSSRLSSDGSSSLAAESSPSSSPLVISISFLLV